jgi:hypothetical protein
MTRAKNGGYGCCPYGGLKPDTKRGKQSLAQVFFRNFRCCRTKKLLDAFGFPQHSYVPDLVMEWDIEHQYDKGFLGNGIEWGLIQR